MNLTRVLQPYVCCLGNPVAGNPTQFVMYRAARACGVDWRFFTSQVEVDQFEVAFRGVQALGLSGMALFEPFQAKAMDLLDSVTESAMCLGGVNVARLDGKSWLGDNTLGVAIANCIEPFLESILEPATSESATVEPAPAILIVGERKIADAIRLANPEMAKRIVLVPVVEPTRIDPLAPRESWELSSLEEFSEKGLHMDCLICQDIPSSALSRQIATLTWSASASCLVLAGSTEKQLRSWRDILRTQNVKQIESVELMSHQSAADFYFWTGVVPSIELIRDSLEEYMQW